MRLLVNMINPTQNDIGRKVVYRDWDGPEDGVITGVTLEFVMVRYGNDQWSKAARHEDLEWMAK